MATLYILDPVSGDQTLRPINRGVAYTIPEGMIGIVIEKEKPVIAGYPLEMYIGGEIIAFLKDGEVGEITPGEFLPMV